MAPSNAASSSPLRRRDLVLLPLLSLLTVAVLLVGSELAARAIFPEQKKDSCEIGDSSLGFKYRANCSASVKAAEGPWVVNAYNACGYRTDAPCGPKPAGTIRIAVIGSSIAEGWLVAYQDTFASRTVHALSTRCRRPAEIQNLGRQLCSMICTFHRVDEALALKPDVLVLTLSPSDMDLLSESDIASRYEPIRMPESMVAGQNGALQARRTFVRRIKAMISESRAVVAVEHYLFQDPETYLKLALLDTNNTAYLRTPYTQRWEEHLHVVDAFLGEAADKAHAAGVPLVLVPFPNAAQAAALSLTRVPEGLDPGIFYARLQGIAARHGIYIVDTFDSFRRTRRSNTFYYLADGHLKSEGQPLISTPLVERLIGGSHPILEGCEPSPQQSN